MKTQQEFNKFDEKHPEFWEMFCMFTQKAFKSGRKKYSARTIYELMRWHTEVDEGSLFKCNNDWVPFYARKWNNATGINFFEIRNQGVRKQNEKLTEAK